MQHSETIGELVGALSKAQGAISNPTKDATVTGSYTFHYATLDGILAAIRKPFSDNGLWFIQTIDGEAMITRILHSSGQWIDCESPMIMATGNKPQDIGSAMTYSKRYGLCMALGIAAEDDDDGNMANGTEVHIQTGGRAAPKKADDVPAWKTYSRKTYKAINDASDLNVIIEILMDGGVIEPGDDPWELEANSSLSQVKQKDADIYGKIVDLVKAKREALDPGEPEPEEPAEPAEKEPEEPALETAEA